MAILQPPAFVADGCYEAVAFRSMVSAMTGGVGGIADGLAWSQSPTPSFQLSRGTAVVPGVTAAEGSYLVTNDTFELGLSAASPHPTLPYRGIVVARVESQEFGDASNTGTIEVVNGTPAATPVLPAAPARSAILYTFTVPSAASGQPMRVDERRSVAGQFTGLPIGSIIAFPNAGAPPANFLRCNGQTYAIADYPDLYAAIGNNYGGSSTHFNVPDLRGRVPIGVGSAQGDTTSPAHEIGDLGGVAKVALTVAQMPSHNHTMATAGAHTHQVRSSQGPGSGTNALGLGMLTIANDWDYPTNTSGAHTHTINNNGSGQTHENLPPYTVVQYLIRAR